MLSHYELPELIFLIQISLRFVSIYYYFHYYFYSREHALKLINCFWFRRTFSKAVCIGLCTYLSGKIFVAAVKDRAFVISKTIPNDNNKNVINK